MTVTVQCPKLTCRSILQVPEKVRGKKIRCGKCGATFLVPGGTPEGASKTAARPSK